MPALMEFGLNFEHCRFRGLVGIVFVIWTWRFRFESCHDPNCWHMGDSAFGLYSLSLPVSGIGLENKHTPGNLPVRGCSSVVERSLSMWEAPGSIPGTSIYFCQLFLQLFGEQEVLKRNLHFAKEHLRSQGISLEAPEQLPQMPREVNV